MSQSQRQNAIFMNTTVLAYLGDAVYEIYIRKHVVDTGQLRADRLHQASVRYVRAGAQARVIRELLSELPEEQQALVKRARNHKSATKPKNADPVEYKWATAFEALAGYLYLEGRQEELLRLFQRAVVLIDQPPEKKEKKRPEHEENGGKKHGETINRTGKTRGMGREN